jgi:hypothetical protein
MLIAIAIAMPVAVAANAEPAIATTIIVPAA